MSEYVDFYPSWTGSASFGASSVRLRDQEPNIFSPLDLSGCQIWMNAFNNDAVVYNDLLLVTSWSNQGLLGGVFSNAATTDVFYGAALQNGLRTVSFNCNAYLQGQFALNFQARSIFFVTIETVQQTGGSNANPLITSDTSNGMELFSLVNGQYLFFLGKHPSPIPEIAFDASNNYLNTAVLIEFINDTDISNNWAGVNGRQYTTIFDAAASGYNTSNIPYYLGGYFGGSTTPTAQNMCEVIVYDRALSQPEREQVETYLRIKWNIQEPPPPPFSPSSITGLEVWLDANQGLNLSNTDVLSWSNIGLTSNQFDAGCNIATLYTDINGFKFVNFPSQTTLESYYILNYYSRTFFVVFQNLTDLTTITYPYEDLMNANATGGRQIGVYYDSNTSNYYFACCQNGYNCPIQCSLPTPLAVGGTNILIGVVDSNSTSNTLGYFNGGSNLNTSIDVGNLFNVNPIPYAIGSANSDSPAFRMGEMLEYNSVLTTDQISTVANYLVTKWAISSFVALS